MKKKDIKRITLECADKISEYDIKFDRADFYPRLTVASFANLRSHFPVKNKNQHPNVFGMSDLGWGIMFNCWAGDIPREDIIPTPEKPELLEEIVGKVWGILEQAGFKLVSIHIGMSVDQSEIDKLKDRLQLEPNEINRIEVKTRTWTINIDGPRPIPPDVPVRTW